jgi:hypothetical protein
MDAAKSTRGIRFADVDSERVTLKHALGKLEPNSVFLRA